uniref:COP9 signalosome complex subunit 3 n=1 Tax=Mesocestoides corti TaxID=53468 RepID=A0A5K3EGN4_MESCO
MEFFCTSKLLADLQRQPQLMPSLAIGFHLICYLRYTSATFVIRFLLFFLHQLNTSNNSVFRRLKFALDVYKKLADAFAEPDPTVLARVVEENMATFVLDKNYGLVKQLFDYHIKSRIQNLTKTFMSLSLKDLAARVHLSGPKEAERHLLEMIASKSIFVKIDQRNGTIRFLDNPEQYDSPEMLKLLSDKMNAAMNLQKNLLQISDHSVVEDATEIKKQPRNVSNLHAPASKRKTPSE